MTILPAFGGNAVQTRRTADQYRAIDLSLFALMLMVFETVIVRAAKVKIRTAAISAETMHCSQSSASLPFFFSFFGS